jgi:hypothetical protein
MPSFLAKKLAKLQSMCMYSQINKKCQAPSGIALKENKASQNLCVCMCCVLKENSELLQSAKHKHSIALPFLQNPNS